LSDAILIAGCGYLGSALGLDLANKGVHVWGLRREWLVSPPAEITPITADFLNPETLEDLPQADFVVLCQAPKRETDSYRSTYLEGTGNLLVALKGKEPKKLILISSTSVYGTADGSWVDEKTPVGGRFESKKAEENAKALIETEKLVLSSGFPAVVLRLGGIYGPGRHRLLALKEGKMKPSFSETFVNRIAVEDAASAIKLLMEKGKPGEIYLGVDDHPSTQKEFYEWIYERSGWPRPAANGASPAVHGSNKRCSNKKLKALGWVPKYPSFREGYDGLIHSAVH
jgi:nucleoside-diphosphate-sugar epimerase